MDYRQKLYAKYFSTHTGHLYGELTPLDVKRQFPVWKYYYGRFLPPDKKARILDMGCGNGSFMYWLKELGYREVTGVDNAPEQVAHAKRLGVEQVVLADLSDFLRDKKGCYDLVFARDVLEHFKKEEILDILSFVHGALRDGGGIVIQSPNAEGPFISYRYWDFTHEIAFTRSSLSQILRSIGFGHCAFYPAGPVAHGLKSLVRLCLWKAIEVMLRFYLLVERGSGEGIFTQNLICIARK